MSQSHRFFSVYSHILIILFVFSLVLTACKTVEQPVEESTEDTDDEVVTEVDVSYGYDMMIDYFSSEVDKIQGKWLDEFQNREDFEKKLPEKRQQYADMIGLWPIPERTDLNPVVTGTIVRDGIEVRKLHFQSLPGSHKEGPILLNIDKVFDLPQALAAVQSQVRLSETSQDSFEWTMHTLNSLGMTGQIAFTDSPVISTGSSGPEKVSRSGLPELVRLHLSAERAHMKPGERQMMNFRSEMSDGSQLTLSDLSREEIRVLSLNPDIETFMESDLPLTTFWDMHVWGREVEPMIHLGPEFGDEAGQLGSWEELRDLIESFDVYDLIIPLAIRKFEGQTTL